MEDVVRRGSRGQSQRKNERQHLEAAMLAAPCNMVAPPSRWTREKCGGAREERATCKPRVGSSSRHSRCGNKGSRRLETRTDNFEAGKRTSKCSVGRKGKAATFREVDKACLERGGENATVGNKRMPAAAGAGWSQPNTRELAREKLGERPTGTHKVARRDRNNCEGAEACVSGETTARTTKRSGRLAMGTRGSRGPTRGQCAQTPAQNSVWGDRRETEQWVRTQKDANCCRTAGDRDPREQAVTAGSAREEQKEDHGHGLR
ncbi:hypothetical protein ERJ75_001130300 [Trypanosoma vivax]|nr:hypothetical protein ERJ75_001130300 [Trypanosoma vivax]